MKRVAKLDPRELLWVMVLLAGLSSVGQARAQARYTYSANGAEVTDVQVGLVWRRCSEGQIWGAGICSGTPTTFTHEQALAYTRTQTVWRVPNVKELSSLVDTSRFNPAIDGNAFPLTPSVLYWSSSPDVRLPSLAWAVDFGLGGVVSSNRYSSTVLLRLVR
ncbi:MAG: DUF1566 domain-containing protein [Comamonadaceae bacterium]